MGTAEKLDERVRSKPKDLTFAEIERFLNNNGFHLDRSNGSHRIFSNGMSFVTITCPHGGKNTIPTYQIRQVLEAIDKTTEE